MLRAAGSPGPVSCGAGNAEVGEAPAAASAGDPLVTTAAAAATLAVSSGWASGAGLAGVFAGGGVRAAAGAGAGDGDASEGIARSPAADRGGCSSLW